MADTVAEVVDQLKKAAKVLKKTAKNLEAEVVPKVEETKKTVRVLSVDHVNLENVIAIFENAQKGLDFLQSKGLDPVEKVDDKEYYVQVTTDGEGEVRGLFDFYYTKWDGGSAESPYDINLKERDLNEQFVFEHNE